MDADHFAYKIITEMIKCNPAERIELDKVIEMLAQDDEGHDPAEASALLLRRRKDSLETIRSSFSTISLRHYNTQIKKGAPQSAFFHRLIYFIFLYRNGQISPGRNNKWKWCRFILRFSSLWATARLRSGQISDCFVGLLRRRKSFSSIWQLGTTICEIPRQRFPNRQFGMERKDSL